MTGPEHYAEAQRLLAIIPDGTYAGESVVRYPSPEEVARAQAHALLALAAATAEQGRALDTSLAWADAGAFRWPE